MDILYCGNVVYGQQTYMTNRLQFLAKLIIALPDILCTII